jgi:hypothetical protein
MVDTLGGMGEEELKQVGERLCNERLFRCGLRGWHLACSCGT